MATSLPTLPAEVVEAIASALDIPADIFSLRLTCKTLNQKTLHHFGQTHFTIIRTDFSSRSLRTLQSVSESEKLRHRVQTLLIKGDDKNELGAGFRWHRNPAGHVETSRSSGVQMLRDILLKGLTNCRSFHVDTRGGIEELYKPEYVTPSDAIGIVLAIIAETGIPVQSFFVDFRDAGSGSVDAKRLQMRLYQQPKFRTAWTHVQELRLEYCLRPDTFDWARDLVLQTTSLRKLSLVFDFDCSISFIDSLLPSPHTIQGLREFKLGSVHVTVEMLSTLLLHACSTLQAISFWHVYLQAGTWIDILNELRSSFPLLESVAIDWPKEYRNEQIIHVGFPTLDDDPAVPGLHGRKFELKYKKWKAKRRVWGASYQGRIGMDKALEILAESVEYT